MLHLVVSLSTTRAQPQTPIIVPVPRASIGPDVPTFLRFVLSRTTPKIVLPPRAIFHLEIVLLLTILVPPSTQLPLLELHCLEQQLLVSSLLLRLVLVSVVEPLTQFTKITVTASLEIHKTILSSNHPEIADKTHFSVKATVHSKHLTVLSLSYSTVLAWTVTVYQYFPT